jgi:DNA polymerase-1
MRQSGAVTDSRVLLAVDGNSLVHRSFHALAATGMRSPDGRPIWAVRGLLTQLVAAVERIGPTAVVVGFDDPAASVRRDRWPQYKATRTDKLDSLVQQLELAVEVLRSLGIAVSVPAGLEADDVLASAAAQAGVDGSRTVIMTSDRDSFALIAEHTSVLRIINGGVEASPLLTPERLVTMIGVKPEQYRDYAALRGDPSDNLPGVRGIGPKTAAKLLSALGSARVAFEDLEAGGVRVQQAIGAGAAARLADPDARVAWELNCQVMSLHADVPLEPGHLPLDAAVVRTAFTEHQLPSTLPTALRVLAHEDIPAMDAVLASNRPPQRTSSGWSNSGWSGRRYPKLPPKPAPSFEQLPLFS